MPMRGWFDAARARREAEKALEEARKELQRIEAERNDLRRRLNESERALRERSEALYEVQRHYSTEHFELQQSMRELDTERLRNAGAYGMLRITLERARALQRRIAALKERLCEYESVDDEHFDTAPILDEGTESQDR
jgi:chromosome segregation ATPase